MEILILLVLGVVGFFVWQGFRVRCPKCGLMALHTKDSEAEKKQHAHYENLKKTGLLKSFDESGIPFGSDRSKPGYANAKIKCKACGWSFSRREAVIWLTTANKLGEEVAISEYDKLQNDNT